MPSWLGARCTGGPLFPSGGATGVTGLRLCTRSRTAGPVPVHDRGLAAVTKKKARQKTLKSTCTRQDAPRARDRGGPARRRRDPPLARARRCGTRAQARAATRNAHAGAVAGTLARMTRSIERETRPKRTKGALTPPNGVRTMPIRRERAAGSSKRHALRSQPCQAHSGWGVEREWSHPRQSAPTKDSSAQRSRAVPNHARVPRSRTTAANSRVRA